MLVNEVLDGGDGGYMRVKASCMRHEGAVHSRMPLSRARHHAEVRRDKRSARLSLLQIREFHARSCGHLLEV